MQGNANGQATPDNFLSRAIAFRHARKSSNNKPITEEISDFAQKAEENKREVDRKLEEEKARQN